MLPGRTALFHAGELGQVTGHERPEVDDLCTMGIDDPDRLALVDKSRLAAPCGNCVECGHEWSRCCLVLSIVNLHSGDETGQGKVRTKMIRGAGMNFQRGMWAEAWVQAIRRRKFIALAIFAELAMHASVEWFAIPSGVKFFMSGSLWSCLAYMIHSQILLPPNSHAVRNIGKVFGFAVVGIGFSVMAMIVGLLTGIAASKLQIYSPTIVFMMFVFLILPPFVWLSTILPAYVADRARGVRVAIARGNAHFGWIAGHLLLGPIPLTFLSASVYWWLASHLRSSRQTDYDGPLWDKEWVFQPAEVPLMCAYYSIQATAVVLTAVILSRAFLRAEGMPDAAAA